MPYLALQRSVFNLRWDDIFLADISDAVPDLPIRCVTDSISELCMGYVVVV